MLIRKEVIFNEGLQEPEPHMYSRRLTTLRVSSEAENEEPQPQNKRGKPLFCQTQGEHRNEKHLDDFCCIDHGACTGRTSKSH